MSPACTQGRANPCAWCARIFWVRVMGFRFIDMAWARYCITATAVECLGSLLASNFRSSTSDAKTEAVYPSRYRLPEVTAAVLAALERRRPGFAEWSSEVEAQLSAAADAALRDVGRL